MVFNVSAVAAIRAVSALIRDKTNRVHVFAVFAGNAYQILVFGKTNGASVAATAAVFFECEPSGQNT